MLCAIPGSATNSLELVRLVFQMVALKEQPVPENLKDMVVDVIGEAQELSENPTLGKPLRHPESVLLALEIRNSGDLAASLKGITRPEELCPEIAGRVLNLMETHPA